MKPYMRPQRERGEEKTRKRSGEKDRGRERERGGDLFSGILHGVYVAIVWCKGTKPLA